MFVNDVSKVFAKKLRIEILIHFEGKLLNLRPLPPQLVKNGNYFSLSWIILRYRLIFVGFVVFLSDIVLPEKCTSVHNF